MSGTEPAQPDADGWISPAPADVPPVTTPPVFRWDVTADLIDVDRVAEILIRQARRAGGSSRRTSALALALLVLVLVFVVGILAVGEGGGLVTLVPLLPLGILLAFMVGPGGRWLTQRRLRREPALTEPYVVVADGRGTQSTASTGADSLAWSRYRAATTDDEHLVLEQTGSVRMFRIVPWAALDPRSGSREQVLATIQAWIAAAGGASRPA